MHAPRTRVQRRPVHGVLLLDKPLGLSSNQALQRAKWLLRAEKAGHTGTLDPLASGVLPLCFGAATKFSQLHLDADKCYVAEAQLGVRTTTGDAEGDVVETHPVHVTPAALQQAAVDFSGTQWQTPPMFSALKKDGKPLYDYAREGLQVERTAREVVVHRLSLSMLAGDRFRLEACVSKGTYIRTLAEDIGTRLGCGAHLRSLRRTRTGGFELAQCIDLERLEALPEPDRLQALLPVQTLVADHARVTLEEADAARFLSGLRRRGDWPDMPAVAVFGRRPDAFLGTGHVKGGELIPGRLLSPLEIQQTLQNPATP